MSSTGFVCSLYKVCIAASGARQELCSKGLVELEQHKVQDDHDDNKTRTPLKVHSSEFYLKSTIQWE
jgi:hypothetical protein